MSALATLPAPPAPVVSPRPSPVVPIFPGRSFADYLGGFALDPGSLRGKDVLDVGAGASSFVAEACARKINAVAVDPLYGCDAAELAGRLQGAPPGARIAAERFLADFETNFIGNRYVIGALPHLPFLDGTFDLVLCGGLLFGGTSARDPEWNIAACRELMRVSADLVRIAPVCDRSGRAFPGLARLRRELKDAGVVSCLRSTPVAGCTPGPALLELRRAEA
jgi:hypothetical protein